MVKMKTFLVIGLVTAAVSAQWLLNTSVPEGLSDPWTTTLLYAVIKLSKTITNTVELFMGFETSMSIQNKLYKYSFGDAAAFSDANINVSDVMFDGVPVRLYKPKALSPNPPGILYMHGGGWMYGNRGMVDNVVRRMVLHTGAVAVSVDYRMSPPYKFPVHIDDCVTAYKQFVKSSKKFGFDVGKLIITGDSAGGNLAASLALRLRDENFPHQPKLQLLIYPALQAINFHTPSYQENRHDTMLDRDTMVMFWHAYATGRVDRHREHLLIQTTAASLHQGTAATLVDTSKLDSKYVPIGYHMAPSSEQDEGIWADLEAVLLDPYFAPLMAEDLSGLPQCYMLTAQYDVLRDDGILYASRLQEAGVKVTHAHHMNGMHGLISFQELVPEYEKAFDDMLEFVNTNI
jgi:neutral cholesterol ester hydrolase 1